MCQGADAPLSSSKTHITACELYLDKMDLITSCRAICSGNQIHPVSAGYWTTNEVERFSADVSTLDIVICVGPIKKSSML